MITDLLGLYRKNIHNMYSVVLTLGNESAKYQKIESRTGFKQQLILIGTITSRKVYSVTRLFK